MTCITTASLLQPPRTSTRDSGRVGWLQEACDWQIKWWFTIILNHGVGEIRELQSADLMIIKDKTKRKRRRS